jgi:hypothetical protein
MPASRCLPLALVAAVLLLSLPAAAAPATGHRVNIRGCAYAGVTARCLMIKGDDGTVYDISALALKPRSLTRVLHVRGTVSDKASVCMEGIVLERIRWSRTLRACAH